MIYPLGVYVNCSASGALAFASGAALSNPSSGGRGRARRASPELDPYREARGADPARVGKLQKQPVASLARERRLEGDLRPRGPRLVLRMHVQKGEIPLAQGHQVSQGAEVRLEVLDWAAVPAHVKRQQAASTRGVSEIQRNLVTLDPHLADGVGERRGLVVAWNYEVRAQRERFSARGEVREDAVIPGFWQRQGCGPRPLMVHGRVQVLVVREVAAHDHQMHGPLVLFGEIALRPPVSIQDTKLERTGLLVCAGLIRQPRY